MEIAEELVHQTRKILSGGNAADRTGKHIVEHQRRHAEFRQRAAQRLLDGAVDAAANEHAAAFDVHRPHGIRKQHDSQNEPGGSLADVAFRFAARVVRRGGQVIQHDGGGAPEGEEAEEGGSRDQDARDAAGPIHWGHGTTHSWTHVPGSWRLAEYDARTIQGGKSSTVPTFSGPVRRFCCAVSYDFPRTSYGAAPQNSLLARTECRAQVGSKQLERH